MKEQYLGALGDAQKEVAGLTTVNNVLEDEKRLQAQASKAYASKAYAHVTTLAKISIG